VRELRIEGLRLAVGERCLIEDLDLAVAPGEVVTVMGPSGCGKSSLLSWLCGTLEPAFAASGRILLDGVEVQDLPPERRRIGILFQDDLLFPHLSVGENLAFALPASVRGRRERWARVEAALREADLAGFARRDPATLSGGQRARVALMRTLLAEPRALLLDEPFGKLDSQLRQRVRRFVLDHARESGLPSLLVTHDPADADAAGGPVVGFPHREKTTAKVLPLRNAAWRAILFLVAQASTYGYLLNLPPILC
jgi:putative thiamine transport system ATP-binding protein